MKALMLILTATLAACNDTGPNAVASPAERIYTVSEFLDKPELREKVSNTCRNDPGRLAAMPNCINAQEAMRLAFVSTSKGIPSIAP